MIGRIFVRLTGQKRTKAGRLVALLYLLCVLAPGAAPALGGDAPWLPTEIRSAVAVDALDDSVSTRHLHPHSAAHEHGRMHGDDRADAGHIRHDHDGKNSPGPCCAMLCLSAIPATLPAMTRPSPPMSVCIAESYRRLPDTAPPLLYRPPIA